MKLQTRMTWSLVVAAVLVLSSVPAWSGVHLWRIEEVYSNADGTIQFIEMTTCCGSTGGEILIGNKLLSSNTNSFLFPANLTTQTQNNHLLLATAGYAALPGVPAADYTIVDRFFSITGDRVSFSTYDSWTFGPVPTNGVDSLNKDPNDPTNFTFARRNSPTNLHEQTGSIGAAGGPPAVPDGSGGTTPMMVAAPTPDGSNLRLTYDVASCTAGASDHHIIYGQKSGLPGIPGGVYTPLGGVCGIGNTVPYDWIGSPIPDDSLGLIWFVAVITDSTGAEGSWGKDSLGNERNGPGNGGSSGICGLTRSLVNVCGHP